MALNRTVRELRIYQAKMQDIEQAQLGNKSALTLDGEAQNDTNSAVDNLVIRR